MPQQESMQVMQLWRDHLKNKHHSPQQDDSLNIGISASFTADSLIPHLGGHLLAREPRNLQIIPAPYNQIFQTCINPGQNFDGTLPDTLIILWRLEDLFPALLSRDLSNDTDALQELCGEIDKLAEAIATLRNNYQGTVIVSTPPYPSTPRFELADLHQADRAGRVYSLLLSRWLQQIESIDRLQVIDLNGLLSEQGYSPSQDLRKWYLYRQPYTDAFLHELGSRLARLIDAQTKPSKKCVVLDCDNTLWGGILGEDGAQGIDLGEDFPGSCFRDFQKSLLHLKDSGIFLTVASKNNPEDVDEVFEHNDAMVLSKEDISVFQVHWNSKVDSIIEIAGQLNIGLDSIVFVDDSGKEIGEVAERLPEVCCIQTPEEPADIPAILRGSGLFDSGEYTAEDRQRVAMMATEQERAESFANLSEDEFLESLELKVEVFEARTEHLARVTQLINKTNQFNLTTIRRTADEVAAISDDPDARLLAMEVSDRFGEYGLVGVAILQKEGPTEWNIDTLLMSCRVLGRGVETAFIAVIAQALDGEGANTITGQYLATKKNQQVESLYHAHGFNPGANENQWIAKPGEVRQAPEHVTTTFRRTDA